MSESYSPEQVNHKGDKAGAGGFFHVCFYLMGVNHKSDRSGHAGAQNDADVKMVDRLTIVMHP